MQNIGHQQGLAFGMDKLWLKSGRARPALAVAGRGWAREGWQGRQCFPLRHRQLSLLGSNARRALARGRERRGASRRTRLQRGCIQCLGRSKQHDAKAECINATEGLEQNLGDGDRGLSTTLPLARASWPKGAQGLLVAPTPYRHVGFVQVLYLIPVRSTIRLRQQGEEREAPEPPPAP